ncbi:MAG: hypothetical protein GAK43_01132 [Stenotrophomonas maltophilia]|nr:MAG: hypothetical protein GAK43_01132 [Stenotrophomonas maltophilia]
MQATLDFLILIGSLAQLLLYIALGAIGLASSLLLGAVAVFTLRSPGEPVRIAERPRRARATVLAHSGGRQRA